MTEVKPWEPVSGFWLYEDSMDQDMAGHSCAFAAIRKYGRLRVDLKNGQEGGGGGEGGGVD